MDMINAIKATSIKDKPVKSLKIEHDPQAARGQGDKVPIAVTAVLEDGTELVTRGNHFKSGELPWEDLKVEVKGGEFVEFEDLRDRTQVRAHGIQIAWDCRTIDGFEVGVTVRSAYRPELAATLKIPIDVSRDFSMYFTNRDVDVWLKEYQDEALGRRTARTAAPST